MSQSFTIIQTSLLTSCNTCPSRSIYKTISTTIQILYFALVFRQNIKTTFATDTITASTEGSYRCTKEAAFLLKDGTVMSTFNLQYAAFQKNITDFSESGSNIIFQVTFVMS